MPESVSSQAVQAVKSAGTSPSTPVPFPGGDGSIRLAAPVATRESSSRRVHIVRGPGGLPGLEAHIGAWLAFEDSGIQATHCYGTSAGAIISAMQAAGKTAAEAAQIILSLRTEDVIAKRFAWKARCFWLDSFCDPAPIQKLLAELLPSTFAELALPLTVAASCMDTDPAEAALVQAGDLRQAVLASMSIAGVWPYVTTGPGNGTPGLLGSYSDGGTTCPFPIPAAAGRGPSDMLYCLNICRQQASFVERDKNMISRLLWNVEQLQDSAAAEAKADAGARWGRALVWKDLDIGNVSSLEFSQDHALIATAYDATRREILRRRMQN